MVAEGDEQAGDGFGLLGLGDPRAGACSFAGASSMTASVSPLRTESPTEIGSSAMTPALCAVISFSIFIASMIATMSPSATVWPCSTCTFQMLPCIGEVSVSVPGLPRLRSRFFGAARVGFAAPAGAAPLAAARRR